MEARGDRTRARHGRRLLESTTASRARTPPQNAGRSVMTEFEIQRNLRAMNAPRMPQRDLWPAIAARIEAGESSTPRTSRHRWLPLAAAVGTVFAIAGGLLFFALRDHVDTRAGTDDYAMATEFQRISPQQARDEALRSGQDPRLAGA